MAASVLKCHGRFRRLCSSYRAYMTFVEFTSSPKILSVGLHSTKKNFSTAYKEKDEEKTESTEAPKTEILKESDHIDDTFVERFIPITRRSMIRHMMQEKDLLNAEELKKYEKFARSLDSAVVNKYHGVLQELKALFDPINPDKDTMTTRRWNRRERLDNEFWLLQKLSGVMSMANFHELRKQTIDKALKQHKSQEGVMVSVNPNNYDILKIWALGKETDEEELPVYKKLTYRVMNKPAPTPLEFYKRVVVAVRLKRDDKLILKAFKEVPVNALEQLLPDGKVKMSQLDKNVFYTTVGLATLGVVAKAVTYLAQMQVNWTLIITAVMAVAAMRAITVYKNRRNSYLLELNRMLYFKNIANNRGLLSLLVDRAEDELFKEALIVYTFLLANRPPSTRNKDSAEQSPDELGGLTKYQVECKINDWVFDKTKTLIHFRATESLNLLKDLGLASEDLNMNLHVLPLEAAMRNLPITPQSIVERIGEYDIIEGYDRSVYDETDEEYKAERKKRKKYGWF